jgi:hypothetical protein
MSPIRVAIAGTCGLALLIAREIHDSTSHQLVVLSRTVGHTYLECTTVLLTQHKHQSVLMSQGYQCQTVDYNKPSSLQHALMGVDTVISTVTGDSQLRLIEAAIQCRVRRFAPAEFEGRPRLRGQNDILDRGRNAALDMLRHYRRYIQSTVYVCGIFYERFAVNGLHSHRIGIGTGLEGEGSFIADLRNMQAIAPVYDAAQNYSYLCMTSIHDVARFVVRSLDMSNWPPEMSMCGERMSVNALVQTMVACRGLSSSSLVLLQGSY